MGQNLRSGLFLGKLEVHKTDQPKQSLSTFEGSFFMFLRSKKSLLHRIKLSCEPNIYRAGL